MGLKFPIHYKLVFVNDRTGYIASNHEKQVLYISKDLKLDITDDEKLRATFPNFRPKPQGGFGCCSSYHPETDCSVIISDPSVFNYCIQEENGEYKLSGSKVTFKGTTQNDRLVLDECVSSTIDLGEGNDTVRIGSDSRPIYFAKNKIKTGNGDDTVKVFGNFKRFTQNEFFLGKGSDTFEAEINPGLDDDVKTYSDYTGKLHKYGSSVSKNEIYAIEGYTVDGDTKGWFEKNIFTSKTYSANQLFKYISGGDNSVDGFQQYNYKPEPKQVFKSLTKTNPAALAPSKKEPQKTESAYAAIQRKHDSGAIASQILDPELTLKDPKAAVKKARKAAQEYADSFQELVDAMKNGVNK